MTWQGRRRPHADTPFDPWRDVPDITDHIDWWQRTARNYPDLCQVRRTPEGIGPVQLWEAMKTTGFVGDDGEGPNSCIARFRRLCEILELQS